MGAIWVEIRLKLLLPLDSALKDRCIRNTCFLPCFLSYSTVISKTIPLHFYHFWITFDHPFPLSCFVKYLLS